MSRHGVLLCALGLGALGLLVACGRGRVSEDSKTRVEATVAKALSSMVEVPAAPKPACAEGRVLVPAGEVWVGTKEEVFDQEENPRFRTKVAALCVDATEVTTAAYEACMQSGACSASHLGNVTCNTVDKGRGDHPINCVDHAQATSFCAAHEGRLPTEVEWEYLARGGLEDRPYGIQGEDPEGKVCWKTHQSCPVKSFPAGPFGLFDLTGNVWEWTSDWFGRHPWPASEGRQRIYKGGGWSRRFEKWLRPNLRNRLDPSKSGSHLGFRCVASPADRSCPYGIDERTQLCRAGVEAVQCLPPLEWNGVRCKKRWSNERCPAGTVETPGYGCVAPLPTIAKGPLDVTGVTRVRSPEFDEDCATNQPKRPHAYRYEGSGHLERNQVSKADGCKNRDVGVGFNSACCP